MKEIEQDVRSADEGSVDFQPDVPHQVVPENKRSKKRVRGHAARRAAAPRTSA